MATSRDTVATGSTEASERCVRRIRRVRIVGAVPELPAVGRELVDRLERSAPVDGEPGVDVSLAAWSAADADPSALDRAVRAPRGPFELRLLVDRDSLVERAIVEVLTRCQCMLGRTNIGSATPAFARALAVHRRLHDLGKPLVEADYWHALDTWQWVLRLQPTAGVAVQLAALFHDSERLVSEADRRIEHLADDYQSFKDAHAQQGARLVARWLTEAALPAPIVDRTAELIARHERPGRDPELALLNDADSLSFFSLNTPGFLDYFGPAHTVHKVRYTLRRLRARHRWRLAWIRLRADVRAIVRDVIAREGWSDP